MIDCKECLGYVNGLFNRGEITKDEIEKVTIDRHLLKKCTKKNDYFMEWLNVAIENQHQLKKESMYISFPEWNQGYFEALLNAKERYEDFLLTNGVNKKNEFYKKIENEAGCLNDKGALFYKKTWIEK